jgi:hypothetical protein
MNPTTFLYGVLPFVISIVLKIVSYRTGGEVQKQAIKEMLDERITKDGKPLLDDGQIAVMVTTTSYAVRSYTVGSTLIASLIALLIVALKYPHPVIWACFGVDVLLTLFVWIRVHRHQGTWLSIWGLPLGEFVVWMSFLVDLIGVGASVGGPLLKP